VTRRRTLTDADLGLFMGVAGDFTPLHLDSANAPRPAPAPFLAAAAIGLGSIDSPQPASAGTAAMSWRFLSPVRAGDTIHARWRLTQKRALDNPRLGLAVWRVEVLNQGGTLCADGELAVQVTKREAAPAQPARRRRRRRGAAAQAPEAAATAAEPAPADASPPARRRRRRRSGSGTPATAAPASTAPP